MVGIEARAHAGAGGKHASLDRQRLLKRDDDFVRALHHLVGRLHVLDQHGELVAAQACEHAARTRGAAQPLGHDLQNAIAEVVPERVVDGLEVVEVDEQEGKLLAGTARTAQRAAEA